MKEQTKQYLFKIDLSKYLDEYFYALLIDRREQNFTSRRWIILVVFKDKNLDKLLKLKKISKSDLYLNPLPIQNHYFFSVEKIKWELIREMSFNIDLIKNWAFKSSMYPMTHRIELLKSLDWVVSINDIEAYYGAKFNTKWSNLELSETYSIKNIDFRLAIEYCRINKIPFEKGIKGFNTDSFLDLSLELPLIYYTSALVDVYQELPDEEKGKCLELPKDVEIDNWLEDMERREEATRKKEMEESENEAKNEEEQPSYFIIAHIPDSIGAIMQSYDYEDKLMEYLDEQAYGLVTGGGSSMNTETGKIVYFEIEFMLYGDKIDKKKIKKIITKLEEWGAPKGSNIFVVDTEEIIEFGLK